MNCSLTEFDRIGLMPVGLLQGVLDSIPDPIFVKDRRHRWIAFNDAFCDFLGYGRDDLLGRSDPDLFPEDQVEVFWRMDDELFTSGQPNDSEEFIVDASGATCLIWTRKFPMRDASGEVVGLCGIISDLSKSVLKERLDRAERAVREREEQARLIEAQNALLDALALPIVTVWDHVLLVPFVGEISELRATRALQALLEEILRAQAELVILDITGVLVIDERTADHLLRTVRAAELLGARCALCGMAPHVARTLVSANMDLGGILTYGRLQDALRQEVMRREPRLAGRARALSSER